MNLEVKIKQLSECIAYNNGMYLQTKNKADKSIYKRNAFEFAKQRKRFVTIYEKTLIEKTQLKLL